jgi:tRNA dimethylallyltransferase
MTQAPEIKIIIICGPTASGKSDLAVRLANTIDAEIINADSMQVYRGMNIGTAKPSLAEMGGVRHHLIDIVDPDHPFSAADFVEAADRAIKDIVSRGKQVIVVGGTGLYLRALIYGLVDSPSGSEEVRRELQKEAAELGPAAMFEKLRGVDPELVLQMHPNNLVRIIRALEVYHLTGTPLSEYQRQHGFSHQRYNSLRIGILTERNKLYQRIEVRVDKMLADGLLEEVNYLLSKGYSPDLKSLRSIGYKEAVAFLKGQYTLDQAAGLIKRDTRHYAKRQMTWFNADNEIIWLEYPQHFDTISKLSIEFFKH